MTLRDALDRSASSDVCHFQLARQSRKDVYRVTGYVRPVDGFIEIKSVGRFELGVYRRGFLRRSSVRECELVRPGRAVTLVDVPR